MRVTLVVLSVFVSLFFVAPVALSDCPPPPNGYWVCTMNGENTCACNQQKVVTCIAGAVAGWMVDGGPCETEDEPCDWHYWGSSTFNCSVILPAGTCYEWIKFYRVKAEPVEVPRCHNGECPRTVVTFDDCCVEFGPVVEPIPCGGVDI